MVNANIGKLFILIVGLLGFCGCKTGFTPTFVQSVKEHKIDTYLVNHSLIMSLKEERDRESRPEVKEAYQEIINNLTKISHQADILYQYVLGKMSEDDLAAVLKAKWRIEP